MQYIFIYNKIKNKYNIKTKNTHSSVSSLFSQFNLSNFGFEKPALQKN